MGRQPIPVIVFLLFAFPAFAQSEQPVKIETLCRDLVPYQPSADVNYIPGKDVDRNGKPIVSADVEGSPQLQMPNVTTVQITVDQAAQLGLPSNVPYRPEAYIGQVSVEKNGDVYFNGQRISQPQVQALCNDKKPKNSRSIYGTKKRAIVPVDLPN